MTVPDVFVQLFAPFVVLETWQNPGSRATHILVADPADRVAPGRLDIPGSMAARDAIKAIHQAREWLAESVWDSYLFGVIS